MTENIRICAIDTETTSLRHDRRIWEIAVIVRHGLRRVHPDGPDTYVPEEHRWFIDSDDLDIANADLTSLKIGGYHERHPDMNISNPYLSRSERQVMREVEALTRGAHLIGAVVSFDTEALANRMRAHNILPSWHYHLIDIEALALGYLNGQATALEAIDESEAAQVLRETAKPPWKSHELTANLGISTIEAEEHTALGDARWAMRVYDKVMGVSNA